HRGDRAALALLRLLDHRRTARERIVDDCHDLRVERQRHGVRTDRSLHHSETETVRGHAMSHHFGEIAIDVEAVRTVEGRDTFRVVITSQVSGARVEMTIPRNGMYSDPSLPIERNTVEAVAREVAHLLRRMLE